MPLPPSVDAETELRNWARWCNSTADCKPSKYVTNWQLIDSIQYKNCHETTQERLDEVMAQQPIEEPAAERVDLWVRQFDPIPRIALRVHYVYMPEGGRYRDAIVPDRETWQAWRAAEMGKKLRYEGYHYHVSVEEYEQAVSDGVGQVQYWLDKWVVGV